MKNLKRLINFKDLTIGEIIISIAHILFLIIVFVVLIYMIIMHKSYKDSVSVFDDESIEEWNDSWEVNYEGNIEQNVSLPIELPVSKGNTVIIRKKLPDKLKQYNCLMLESRRQDVIVSIGGIQRQAFSDREYRAWGKSSPSGVVLVPLYNTDSLADVAIHVSSDSFFSGKLGKIYLGDEKSLIIMLLKKNVIWLFLSVIVLIIGLICAITYIIYANQFKISKALLHLAVFAVLSAFWSLSQSGMRQIFINDLTTLETLGYSLYMLLPIPLMQYVNWIMNKKYQKITIWFILVLMVNFIVQNMCQIFGGIGLYDMRFISQSIFILGIILIALVCVLEGREEFDKKVRSLVVGTIGLLLGILSEITFQNLKFGGNEYNRFIGGAFVFLFTGFFYCAMCIRDEQQQKKDAESANFAKTRFLATMSHEIKTPINAVLGMNEIILRDTKEDNIRECAENINNAGKSLLSLVNDILDFSKIEAGKMDIIYSKYQSKTLYQDIIMMTETKINEKGLNFIVDVDDSIPSVCFGDEMRIKQVITNLLSNAAKYTEKGEVVFTVKNQGIINKEIDIFISVKDTGVGIREEDIARFMESFERVGKVLNSNISGTGLGLSISNQILDLMGSKLEVSSVYGKGSEFSFVLHQKVIDFTPMGSIHAKKEIKVRKRKINFTAPGARILSVDDNRVNLTVLSGILKPTQMRIDTCMSGVACLEMCRIHKYDLIILDYMMPEMDGIETLKRLRANKEFISHDVPVIVLTANTVEGAKEMFETNGFDYYLKKPIDISELNEALQRYIPQEKILTVESD